MCEEGGAFGERVGACGAVTVLLHVDETTPPNMVCRSHACHMHMNIYKVY